MDIFDKIREDTIILLHEYFTRPSYFILEKYLNSTNKILSKVGCRVIWNKIIRRKTLLKSIEYIGKKYYKNFFVTAEDTIINLISLHFAQNYSNINFPGYMNNLRIKSMTHGVRKINNEILFCYNKSNSTINSLMSFKY
jgi:hypothetical protein